MAEALHAMQNRELKILLLDDEAIVSMDIAMQIEDLGHSVMGPFHDAASALRALQLQRPDGAIIDFNLGRGETSRPVAEYLIKADIPFHFLSGYSSTGVLKKAGLGDHKVLSKPVSTAALSQSVSLLAG